MKRKRNDILIHAILICISALTLLPFAFVLNNSLRTNSEMNHNVLLRMTVILRVLAKDLDSTGSFAVPRFFADYRSE